MQRSNKYALRIKVNDVFIDEYVKNNQVFVEGRKGSEYSIHFNNYTPDRVKILLSVDGLNTLTGDNVWKRGYVVEPYSYADIPGWRINSDVVSQFKFNSKNASYNQHNVSGDENNIGVIGCMVFKEVKRKYSYETTVHPMYHEYRWNKFNDYRFEKITMFPIENINSTYGYNVNNVDNLCSYGSCSPRGVAPTFNGPAMYPTGSINCSAGVNSSTQDLGTEWGTEKQFKTATVYYNFEETPQEILEIYYDSKSGLQARGIVVDRKVRREPNAFPGFKNDGCPYPI